MNERIREFAIQSGSMEWGDSVIPATMNIEKFAELIVRECIEQVKDFYQEDRFDCFNAAERIKEHFGVDL